MMRRIIRTKRMITTYRYTGRTSKSLPELLSKKNKWDRKIFLDRWINLLEEEIENKIREESYKQ